MKRASDVGEGRRREVRGPAQRGRWKGEGEKACTKREDRGDKVTRPGTRANADGRR